MSAKTWDAQSYSENSQLQYQASKKLFDKLTLKGNETILDIGCGTGLLTSEITKRAPEGKVIGIDSSADMIKYAKEHFSLANLEFILMRAEELSFTFQFDVIISSFCFHWIKNKQALFNKIAAHLHENGVTSFIMPFRHQGVAKIRSDLMTEKKWASYFKPEEAKEILVFDNKYDHYATLAGLNKLVFETEDVTTYFEDKLKLRTFLKNVTSLLDRLPTEELRDDFMQDVVNQYLETNPPSKNGTCSVVYTYGKIGSQGIKNNNI